MRTGEAIGLRLTDVSVRFGSTTVVRSVSFSLAEGRVLALLGANGSGKSTLMRAAAGLVRHSGRVHITAPPGTPPVFLPGETFPAWLDPNGLLRMLAHATGRPSSVVGDVLSSVELDTRRRYAALSTGQRRRVAVAAAAIVNPAVVLLDEPWNGLDEAGSRHVERMISEWAATGRIVVVSSHWTERLESLATDVAVIAGGQVVASTLGIGASVDRSDGVGAVYRALVGGGGSA